MDALIAQQETRLHGLPISEGVAYAPAHVIEAPEDEGVPFYTVSGEQAAVEIERLRDAQRAALSRAAELFEQVTRRAGAGPAGIFTAQTAMLQDPFFMDEIVACIVDNGLNAEAAVMRVTHGYESQLGNVEDAYMRERVGDIVEIRRMLLAALRAGRTGTLVRGARTAANGRHIVVAEELTPSETVVLDPALVAGFITGRGGPGSHAAILARALGIPAVSGIANVTHAIPQGSSVLFDGASGDVYVNPADGTLKLYPAARKRAARGVQMVAATPGFRVMANISLGAELASALEAEAEGIGLYRTEFEFLAAGKILSEDEQYTLYRRAVEAMDGRPLYVRLFDFGSDKHAAFLDIPPEDNPCLGFRGARLLLGRPTLLTDQARALARASVAGPVHVIHPMIVDVEQFLVLRERVAQNTADIKGAQLKHGVMFEVPSACVSAREILEVAEFGSIGSNDLIQYLFAVDRNNELVAHDYNANQPALWRLLKEIADAARDAKRPLSLCGEMGGQPQYLPRLIEIGIRTVSVSPRLIGLARMAARRALRA